MLIFCFLWEEAFEGKMDWVDWVSMERDIVSDLYCFLSESGSEIVADQSLGRR